MLWCCVNSARDLQAKEKRSRSVSAVKSHLQAEDHRAQVVGTAQLTVHVLQVVSEMHSLGKWDIDKAILCRRVLPGRTAEQYEGEVARAASMHSQEEEEAVSGCRS